MPFHPSGRPGGWILALLILAALTGCAAPEPTATPVPTLSPSARMGRQIFTRECASCHSLSLETIIVGPSLAGVAGRARQRVSGQDGRTYLLTSILRPDDFLVEGFENLMPTTFGRSLTGEEVDALVDFMLTLE